MSELPWLERLADELSYLTAHLPTTTLLIDAQRGNALAAGKNLITAALCLRPEHGRACGRCQSCHLVRQHTHPDVIWHTQPCKIDDIRTLTEQTQRTPSLAAKRLILLAEIDRYNDHALNALLKTLEEPPAHNHFILTAPNKRAVKPTILSRARCLTIPTPNHEQALAWLNNTHQWRSAEAARALALHHGNPFEALRQRDTLDPAADLALCVAFFANPKREMAYFMHLDGIDQSLLLDYVCAQLVALLTFKQLDSADEYWHNPLMTLSEEIHSLDTVKLHTVYARLNALRQPHTQQVGIAANIKGILIEIMDNPIPIL